MMTGHINNKRQFSECRVGAVIRYQWIAARRAEDFLTALCCMVAKFNRSMAGQRPVQWGRQLAVTTLDWAWILGHRLRAYPAELAVSSSGGSARSHLLAARLHFGGMCSFKGL